MLNGLFDLESSNHPLSSLGIPRATLDGTVKVKAASAINVVKIVIRRTIYRFSLLPSQTTQRDLTDRTVRSMVRISPRPTTRPFRLTTFTFEPSSHAVSMTRFGAKAT